MSRSRKKKKPIGYDYWSRRPYSGCHGYGPTVKKLTHRKERAEAKQTLSKLKKGEE